MRLKVEIHIYRISFLKIQICQLNKQKWLKNNEIIVISELLNLTDIIGAPITVDAIKLSRITTIHYDTIYNYCKGKVTLINVKYLKIFCNVLNCNISDIIEYKK